MIPRFDGAILSQEWNEALWDKIDLHDESLCYDADENGGAKIGHGSGGMILLRAA